MPRHKKLLADKAAERHTVNCTPAQSASLTDSAILAGVSVSQYLLDLHAAAIARGPSPNLAALARATLALRRLASTIDDAAAELQDAVSETEHAAGLITDTGARVDEVLTQPASSAPNSAPPDESTRLISEDDSREKPRKLRENGKP